MLESCQEVSVIFKESARPPWLTSSGVALTRPATTTRRFKESILSVSTFARR
jgi:hypothetical protein